MGKVYIGTDSKVVKKKSKYISLIIPIILLLSIISYMVFIKKRHYYISSGIGPICVDDEVREGVKIIGKFKLKNPHPKPIDDKEILFEKNLSPRFKKRRNSVNDL